MTAGIERSTQNRTENSSEVLNFPAGVSSFYDPEEFSQGVLPPQDLTAEQSVIGSMLLSPNAIADVVEILREVDFYRPNHQMIYGCILDLYGRGEPVDAITTCAELTKSGQLAKVGGPAYVHSLAGMVPTVSNVGFYATIVREKAILRRLVDAGNRISSMALNGSGEVDQIVDRAQAEIYEVTDNRTINDYLPLQEIMNETLEEIEAIYQHDGSLTGVPTGFRDFDELTNGLHAGQFIIVAARPAIGKSTFGLDICRSASIRHKLTSVIFSLEMSRTEIVTRLLSAETKISMQTLRTPGKMKFEDWNKLTPKMGDVSGAPLFIDDSPNMSLMEIRAKCRKLKQKNDLRLVVIDYIQLMSSSRRVENRQQEVSEFSRSLKLLAKELEIPVIAISQLNRGSERREDKKPMLSDLRESGSLEQDADMVVLLHRDDFYDKENRSGEADLIIAKNRSGPTNNIVVAFQGHYSRFVDMARN